MWMVLPVLMIALSASMSAAHLSMSRAIRDVPISPEEIDRIVTRIKKRRTLEEIDVRYGVTEADVTYPDVLQELIEEGLINVVAFPRHTTYDGVARIHYELTHEGYTMKNGELSVWPLG